VTQPHSFNLEGQTILITGASSGFGAHFAELLSEAGAEVILAARRIEKLQETQKKIEAAGGKASCLSMDVSKEESIEAAYKEITKLDCIINNAGINEIGASHELSVEQWDKVLNTNLKGVWLNSKHAIRFWKANQQAGNIINIASILGLRLANQLPAYSASKAGCVHFTKTLTLDYARDNIRANVICPGYFETDINRDFMTSEAGQKQIKRIPYKRMGQLHELNGPLLLLASPLSSYMSGCVLTVDGAHTCSTL
jgi:NAD(P)-dependent dehydrogenase (short-subunit alcohol dehydrogenase family)